MSVHKHPREWAREMDRLMGNGTINKDNYLTDCANAVVYVRESADRIAKLEAELANANFRAKNCAEMAKKFEDRLAAVTAELAASRDQWRTMACPHCATVASLTAERDRLAQEVRDVNQRLGEAWEKLRELKGDMNQ